MKRAKWDFYASDASRGYAAFVRDPVFQRLSVRLPSTNKVKCVSLKSSSRRYDVTFVNTVTVPSIEALTQAAQNDFTHRPQRAGALHIHIL